MAANLVTALGHRIGHKANLRILEVEEKAFPHIVQSGTSLWPDFTSHT